MFLRTLTIPSLFRKVLNVHFLQYVPKGPKYQDVFIVFWKYTLCMENIPYIKLGELLIQSDQLFIATETTPVLLSTELFKCSS